MRSHAAQVAALPQVKKEQGQAEEDEEERGKILLRRSLARTRKTEFAVPCHHLVLSF